MTDDTLREALRNVENWLEKSLGIPADEVEGWPLVKERALAASATDEAEERRVVRDSEWTPLRKDVRPAVPVALDVERLAEAIHEFQSGIGWDRRECSGGRDHLASAAGIADEYAALSEPTDDR